MLAFDRGTGPDLEDPEDLVSQGSTEVAGGAAALPESLQPLRDPGPGSGPRHEEDSGGRLPLGTLAPFEAFYRCLFFPGSFISSPFPPPAGEDHGERVVRAAAVLRRIGRSQGAHAGALSPTVASTSLPGSNLWAVFGSRALKP